MLIGLINKSLAIYGHHAPPALQLKKWRAGETVWDGFMRVGRPCLEWGRKEGRKLKSLGLTVDGISASFCGLGGFAAVCQRPFHRLHKWKRSLRLFLSMVYTTAQRDYAVFWCASSFPNHDFYFISVFQVFYFDVDELSPLLIITLQRNSALYMYAKCIFH